jgi:hypothetical protein
MSSLPLAAAVVLESVQAVAVVAAVVPEGLSMQLASPLVSGLWLFRLARVVLGVPLVRYLEVRTAGTHDLAATLQLAVAVAWAKTELLEGMVVVAAVVLGAQALHMAWVERVLLGKVLPEHMVSTVLMAVAAVAVWTVRVLERFTRT